MILCQINYKIWPTRQWKSFTHCGLVMSFGDIHLDQYWPHDDVIKWKYFPRYWPFVRGIHRSPVNSPHKGQWRWALMFSLICAWTNGWVNIREAGDLRRHWAHYDAIVMWRHQVITLTSVDLSSQMFCGIYNKCSWTWYVRCFEDYAFKTTPKYPTNK